MGHPASAGPGVKANSGNSFTTAASSSLAAAARQAWMLAISSASCRAARMMSQTAGYRELLYQIQMLSTANLHRSPKGRLDLIHRIEALQRGEQLLRDDGQHEFSFGTKMVLHRAGGQPGGLGNLRQRGTLVAVLE